MKELFASILGKPFGIVVFQLLEATQFTIALTLIAFIGGGILGLLITMMRISPNRPLNHISTIHIWLFQATPLLMMLFILGLGLPRLFDVSVNPWFAATIALILYTSAYLADVWRGAINSIPIGQWECSNALGFGFFKTLRLIIMPQAIRVSIAPTVGFLVQIIKGTSLAYIIGFHDLMSIGKRWANAPVTGTEPFVIFPIMALIYFSLCFPLSILSRRIEKKLGSNSSRIISAP